MNYAEDRLDRRARYEDKDTKTGNSNDISPLEADLKKAHSILFNCSSKHRQKGQEEQEEQYPGNDKHNDEYNGDFRDDCMERKIRGHELAGRSLRDAGKNQQSLFHYGQAWVYTHLSLSLSTTLTNGDHEHENQEEHGQNGQKEDLSSLVVLDAEQRAVGDYAQMTEFNGVPEIGILSLLYYFNGGAFSLDDIDDDYHNRNGDEHEYEHEQEKEKDHSCGCGMRQCHLLSSDLSSTKHYHYYIPASIQKSPITQDILSSLHRLEEDLNSMNKNDWGQEEENVIKNQQEDSINNQKKSCSNSNNFLSASSILDQISKQNIVKDYKVKTGKKKNANKQQRHQGQQQQQCKSETDFSSQQILSSSSSTSPIIQSKMSQHIDHQLQFWNMSSTSSSLSVHKKKKKLSPLLQILLLKLLYTNPIGGPFLHLAIQALYSLSLSSMPLDVPSSTSSSLSKFMSKNYKSHWAYYVLIYKIVFGERVKKHKRKQQKNNLSSTYHVPIWDLVYGLDERRWANERKQMCNSSVCCGSNEEKSESNLHYDIEQQIHNTTVTSLLNNVFAMSIPLMLQQQQQPSKSISAPSPISTKLLPSPCSSSFFIRLSTSSRTSATMHKPIYALGDSHVLSFGWQTIRIQNYDANSDINANVNTNVKYRTIIPYPVTGLKAWHTRPNTKFFTYTHLKANLNRLPSSCRTILISAGEIDCREGIGGTLLQGYYGNCDDAVCNTVHEYVAAIQLIAIEFELQILVLPVAPHAYRSEKNGKAKGRAMRRERMVLWNETLRSLLCNVDCVDCVDGSTGGTNRNYEKEEIYDDSSSDKASTRQPMHTNYSSTTNQKAHRRVFLLDYEEKLRFQDTSSPVGFVLNNVYNADYTHMNSAFLPHLEQAIEKCAFNFDLL